MGQGKMLLLLLRSFIPHTQWLKLLIWVEKCSNLIYTIKAKQRNRKSLGEIAIREYISNNLYHIF